MLAHVRGGQGAFVLPVIRLVVAVVRCADAELRVGPAGSRHHDRCGEPGAAVTIVGCALQLAHLSDNGRTLLEGANRTDILLAVTEFAHPHKNLPRERLHVEYHFAPAGVGVHNVEQPATNVIERVLDARSAATRLGEAGFSHVFIHP